MAIHLLDAVTIGQIAAGEIIERPASIVKELVENAVDAGATRVVVRVERGGIDSVEVLDDGSGIEPGELALAVRRHATSKLAVAEDLAAVQTLGFRGEGLASIAAIARLEIVSRTRATEVGTRVRARADTIDPVEPVAAPVGTRVRAEAVFDDVPVRREYLKSPTAEFNRISTWLTQFALAYPRVTFVLRHDDRDAWIMPATDDPQERLAMVFGREAASGLMPLIGDAARTIDGTLRGFISRPGRDRPDRRMQFLFVNGRLLRSTLLAGAWIAGYSTYAMIGRHPYGVLFLDLPPDQVDPNVHPTKSDVRLRHGTHVFDAVKRAIADTLRRDASQRFAEHAGVATRAVFSAAPPSTDGDRPQLESLFASHATNGESVEADPGDVPQRRLRVLAQIDGTFILASDGTSLLLVDQHAAHERIAYEAIVARASAPAPSEPLLVPHVLELDGARSEVLDRAMPALREGGLEIESFGERAYRIVATPAGYAARPFDLAGFLDDLVDEPKARDVRERIWASLACHSVTVAGERLEPDEMTTLVDRLQQCINPMHCPHGRPTMVHLSALEIARMFKRV
jgi:DNA mismatch repair protein MutL